MYTNDVNQPIKNLNVSAKLVEDFSRLNPRKLAKAPKIKFSGYRYNFEKVKQGAKIYHDFEFTNTGKKDLIIRKIKASCGCTIVTPEKKVLKKGETSKINVLFNTSGRKGPQHKTVTIITNDPQNQSVLLHIEGAIIR